VRLAIARLASSCAAQVYGNARAESEAPAARTILGLKRGLFICAVVALALAPAAHARGANVEVVVTLEQPPLAALTAESRTLAYSSFARPRRLVATAPASMRYLARLAAAQRRVQTRIAAAIPGASVRQRYTVVLNGISVVLPAKRVGRLAALPGVVKVWPNLRYHALLDQSPQLIHAPDLWGSDLATAGQGVKIGVLDQGIDPTHPFFSATGFSYPAGFPKGQRVFTTAKIIAARAFPPRGTSYKPASQAFDPQGEHGTHVAGIAAGDYNTNAEGERVSGIAPRAYLGNYKVLTVPTPGFGLDGNSTEIVKGIDAAVKDGMDVLNLSFGEPEIALARDVVVRALGGAVQAGVVPVVAAGNEFEDFGRGSITSPGSTPQAIAVGASNANSLLATGDVMASFSSSGPTPYSLQLKPDLSAPGVGILSSVPRSLGLWAGFSGTSMASPHVAGGAALLLQRHPSWTPAQVKSALTTTAVPIGADGSEAPATRQGAGRVDLLRANQPLVFAAPTGLSFGLLRPGATETRSLSLTDAGGGAGAWTIAVRQQSGSSAASVTTPQTVTAPGSFVVRAAASANAAPTEVTGVLVLSHGGQAAPASRRVPRNDGGRARARDDLPLSRFVTNGVRLPGAPRRPRGRLPRPRVRHPGQLRRRDPVPGPRDGRGAADRPVR
jgi:subtilisin family serine protease